MTVKLCTSQKVSGEPAVWQGMDGSTLEKWVWGGLGWGGWEGNEGQQREHYSWWGCRMILFGD